ncbi:MAG: hypothetical protein WC159_05050 [Sphaerochaetaceae bacterium]
MQQNERELQDFQGVAIEWLMHFPFFSIEVKYTTFGDSHQHTGYFIKENGVQELFS